MLSYVNSALLLIVYPTTWQVRTLYQLLKESALNRIYERYRVQIEGILITCQLSNDSILKNGNFNLI